MKEEKYVVQQGVDGHCSLVEPPRTPKANQVTFHSKSPIIRVPSAFGDNQDSYSSTSLLCQNPTKKRKEESGSASSTPSKKIASPKKGTKWEAWEDSIIKKAVVTDGEKNSNWHVILQDINKERASNDSRTMNALKLHWSQILKVKMLSC